MMNSPPHGQLFKKKSEDWGDLRFVLLAADLIRGSIRLSSGSCWTLLPIFVLASH